MLGNLLKTAAAVAAAIAAAWAADKICKTYTGKHLWEHLKDLNNDIVNRVNSWLRSEQMYGRKYKYLHFCLEGWRSVGMAIAKGAKVVTLQIFADEVNTGETVTIETEELSDCDFDQNGRYSILIEDVLAA